jgi:hypothetical protein
VISILFWWTQISEGLEIYQERDIIVSCEAVSMLRLSKGIVVEEFLLEGYRSENRNHPTYIGKNYIEALHC